MANYLPYLFNIPSLILGIYLFLRSFRIYKPTYKTEERVIKSENWLEKFGTMMKIFSIILILKGGYGLIYANPENYKPCSVKENNGWETNAKKILVKKCMKESGITAINYPKITQEYCECSMDKIINNYTEDEYLIISQKSLEIQLKELLPKFKSCAVELKWRIDSTKAGIAK